MIIDKRYIRSVKGGEDPESGTPGKWRWLSRRSSGEDCLIVVVAFLVCISSLQRSAVMTIYTISKEAIVY